MSGLEGPRDGDTFDPERDLVRLNAQAIRVYAVLRDRKWHTLSYISSVTGDPEASISARIRDLRKVRFGCHTVFKRNLGGGLWEYLLRWNRDQVPPTESEIEEAFGV